MNLLVGDSDLGDGHGHHVPRDQGPRLENRGPATRTLRRWLLFLTILFTSLEPIAVAQGNHEGGEELGSGFRASGVRV